MIINGKKYTLIKDMGLGVFIEISELMKDMGEDQLTLPMLQRFVKNGEKLKRFVCLALESEDQKDKWEDLQHITIPELLEVIEDFFDLSGPLKLAFPDVSFMAQSKQTPTTDSPN